jgi:L-fuculose-phosphate aldolase
MRQRAQTIDELMEQLAEVGRMVVGARLVIASGGNLSGRLPGADEFVVTSAGSWLDRLLPDDFTVMTLDGEVSGGNLTPSSEWKLHHRAYRVRPEVNAVVHVHPQHAVMLDALGHEIRPLTLDHAYYVGSIGRTPYFPNGSDELADAAAEQCRLHNAVILGFHGCCTLGQDAAMAYRRAANLEDAAIATYRCLTLGDTTLRFPDPGLATAP